MGAAQEVIAEVNRRHGSGYVVVRRFSGGRQSGAYLVEDPEVGKAVLKLSTDPGWAPQVLRAAPVAARVREAGWPTPAWIDTGSLSGGLSYQVQEFVLGAVMPRLGAQEVALLLDLVKRQAGLDPDPERSWSAYAREVVYGGRSGFRDRVRTHCASGAAVVAAFDRLCARDRDVELPCGDLVHGDLGTANVLVHSGRISGVVDVEALGSGTRVYDLVSVLREGYLWRGDANALAALRCAAEDIAGPAVVRICAAASTYGVLDFVAAHDGPEEVERAMTGALRFAEDLAAPVR